MGGRGFAGHGHNRRTNVPGVPGYWQEVYIGPVIVIAMLIQFRPGSLRRLR